MPSKLFSMKKPITSVATILLLSFSPLPPVAAQSCEELLKTPVNFSNADGSGRLQEHLALFIQCSGLDSIDVALLTTGPPLETFLVWAAAPDRNPTYGDWLQEMLRFKKTPEYVRMRDLTEKTHRMLQKKATPAEWPQDSALLVEIGLPEQAVLALREAVFKTPPGTRTYYEISQTPKPGKKKPDENTLSPEQQGFIRNDTLDYTEALALARQSGKLLLVYFTGYGAAGAAFMEKEVLADEVIYSFLNRHFVMVALYVDDRKPLPPDQQYTSASGHPVRNVGSKNTDFQISRFRSANQPMFYILNADEKTLAQQQYTRDRAVFLQFLKNGVKAAGQ